MKGLSISKETNQFPVDGLKEALEKKYIEEYLLSRGYHRSDLQKLSKQEAKALMAKASTYASLKLADIESRSRFVKKIHWLA